MSERNDSMNVASLDATHDANLERVRESVSALFDGEASELELRRLLGSEPAAMVHGAWRDYQLQRDALQGAVDMRFAGIDLSARVQAAIAAEAAPASVTAVGGARWWRPLASMAVAASVATVVVLGARNFGPANGFDAGRDSNMVAQNAASQSRAVTLGKVSAGVQPFGPLAAGNRLPGTVFPRNEVVGKGFPAAQTVAFETEQAGPQRGQRYLMQPSERAVDSQAVINFAKVRLSEE